MGIETAQRVWRGPGGWLARSGEAVLGHSALYSLWLIFVYGLITSACITDAAASGPRAISRLERGGLASIGSGSHAFVPPSMVRLVPVMKSASGIDDNNITISRIIL
jgi:hypothetical protein